jgi:VWFA-related protein
MRRSEFFKVAAAGAGVWLAPAQDDVIRVESQLVNLLFTAREKSGALVGNLEQKDVEIYEDGKLQEIRTFTRETDQPLTIGVLVDVSPSQDTVLPEEKSATATFVREVLGKKDMAFLISFGPEVELVQDFTSSAKLFDEGLKQLRILAPTRQYGGAIPTGRPIAGTVLYDAIFLAADEKLKGESGRKVIVVLTDGMDTGSRMSRAQAVEAAHRNDVMIYSIFYYDLKMYDWQRYGVSDSDLKKMGEETGGRCFDPGRRPLLEIYRQLNEELRSQYALSYVPKNQTRNGAFRKIELRVKRAGVKAQARRGYYAPVS